MAINYLTNKGYSRTRSANSAITDSAAGGTALSTGYRTNNGVVGMSPNLEENYQNVLELAAKKKKSTGIIATKAVTDATPAAFSAHVETRALQEEIASQQIKLLEDGTLDILLGGGHVYYRNNKNIELLEEACKKGVTLTDTFSDTLKASLPSIGLFAMDALDSSDSPSLAAMTHLALNKLSENKKGFFLMVEGSKIDTYGHQNNIYREINEMWDFDEAISVAMHFVAQNPDTILIITADHETGGLTLPDEPTKANIGECTYKTVDHTSKNVPVFAVGYGTEKLACEQDNTEIAKFIIKTLKK